MNLINDLSIPQRKYNFMADDRDEASYLENVEKYQQRLAEIKEIWQKISGLTWAVISSETHTDYENVSDKGDLECKETGELIEVKELGHYPLLIVKSYQLRKHIKENISYLIIRNGKYSHSDSRKLFDLGSYLPSKLRIWGGKGDFAIKVEDLEWDEFI